MVGTHRPGSVSPESGRREGAVDVAQNGEGQRSFIDGRSEGTGEKRRGARPVSAKPQTATLSPTRTRLNRVGLVAAAPNRISLKRPPCTATHTIYN